MTFDDLGSELNIFDTTSNLFIYRYVDEGRDISQLVTPGQFVDLHDHVDAQKIVKGSGPEQMAIRGNLLFVSMANSEKVQVFRINPNAFCTTARRGHAAEFQQSNTKHLRAFWDSVPRWLHYGFAHTLRELLLPPDSPLLLPGERGFNFRTVRTDQRRGVNNLPTEVPITVADRSGVFVGDGMGPNLCEFG